MMTPRIGRLSPPRSTPPTLLFTKANSNELCEELTPAAERAWMSVMADAVSLVRGRTCAQQWTAIYRQVPLDAQPRAPKEVQAWNRGGISVDGDRAQVRFEDGTTWDFRHNARWWRIDRFPMLPRGWSDPSDHLTD